MDDAKKKPSLQDSDIVSTPADRRTVLKGAAATVAGVAGAAALSPSEAKAQGYSDNDAGRGADPPGRGRRVGRTGVTDSDGGSNADQPGNGRGGQRYRGTGITDSDSGPNADNPGNGRGGNRRRARGGLTDTDSGPNADQAGRGRSGY
jgi:hypothetical protein